MDKLDKKVRRALRADMTVDITTTGRRSGLPHRIEIWAHYLDGRLIITGSPGRRDWYANMLARPELTFHLKQGIQADLRAIARPIIDEAERRAILVKLHRLSAWTRSWGFDVEEWVKGSCLVEVTFKQ